LLHDGEVKRDGEEEAAMIVRHLHRVGWAQALPGGRPQQPSKHINCVVEGTLIAREIDTRRVVLPLITTRCMKEVSRHCENRFGYWMAAC
jgi:hypothetical protein